MTPAQLSDSFRSMLRIRLLEERVAALYRDGEIPGFVHTSVGQEACAVGALFAAEPQDTITSTHRGHGHVLAKGLDARRMMAELMGRSAGANRGRGGSMHVADPALGVLGANGIVGAGVPIAAGAAFAHRLRGDGGVAIAFFGDGAVSTGAFHEAASLASLWGLPLVLFCENNGYSEFSRTEDQHPVPMRRRAEGYGLRYIGVDGNDVESVALGTAEALRAARAGEGAVFVEATTRRTRGHYEGDQQRYRRDEAAAVDPIERCEARLREEGVDDETIGAIRDEVAAEIEDAVAFARAAAEPDPATFMDDVAPRLDEGAEEPATVGDETTRYSRAVAQALADALEDDASVFLAGIDVASGNVFGLTRGLADRFPGRVLDTPILESAIVGLAVGSAMRGLRPVVEIMYLDFIGVCLDQLLNQAAKLRFMTGGAVSVPMVVRTQFGSGRSSGAQHSQSLEALLAHIPGLSVVMPATAEDAYGLLRSAIDYDGPVVVIENRLLYEKSGPAPERGHRVPLGRARVVREGADVTIVAWSRMVHEAMDAAKRLAERGIDAEVIDLRSIVPLDRETVLRSVAKTNRLVIAHDAVTDFGVGAELAALAAYDGFWTLDAPVERVGAPYSPAPYSPVLEREWIPGSDDIERAALRVVVTDPREIPTPRRVSAAASTS